MSTTAWSPNFAQHIDVPLQASGLEILQLNLGYRCNLECKHCHVQASPDNNCVMSREILDKALGIAQQPTIKTIDITGGAPEMHPDLRWLLKELSGLPKQIIVRSNGVILLEPEYEDFIEHYAKSQVELVLSLPNIEAKTTDRQRGEGVFERLIEAIGRLNRQGYGQPGSGLVLNLVHNPAGAYLPAPQQDMAEHYHQVLLERYGIVFNNLFSITNMPIGRYLNYLKESGNFEDYMTELVNAYNPAALDNVMCKTTLSVGWDGRLYDCDFNQMLGLSVNHGAPEHIRDFDLDALAKRRIVVGNHCFGCTAGSGSSCQGEVT
jgi:radical SAM/Cys-rich protein